MREEQIKVLFELYNMGWANRKISGVNEDYTAFRDYLVTHLLESQVLARCLGVEIPSKGNDVDE